MAPALIMTGPASAQTTSGQIGLAIVGSEAQAAKGFAQIVEHQLGRPGQNVPAIVMTEFPLCRRMGPRYCRCPEQLGSLDDRAAFSSSPARCEQASTWSTFRLSARGRPRATTGSGQCIGWPRRSGTGSRTALRLRPGSTRKDRSGSVVIFRLGHELSQLPGPVRPGMAPTGCFRPPQRLRHRGLQPPRRTESAPAAQTRPPSQGARMRSAPPA